MKDNSMNNYINKYNSYTMPIVHKICSFFKIGTSSLIEERKSLTSFEQVLDEKHIVSHKTRSKEADVFRFLRTQVLQSMSKHGLKTIAVTSPRYGDGKTTTSTNLAISISQDLKQTVLLVDIDLRKPSLASYLNLDVKQGLSNFLCGDATVQDCLIKMPFERLSVFPAGDRVDESSETLGSPHMAKLAHELKQRYDDRVIIYDMPPLLEQDDPLVFLPHVDGILLVAREGVTTVDEIRRSLDILQSAKILGVVLNAG